MKVLSYGGGLDSFGMLVWAIHTGELPDVVAFCDVADPEHKDPGEWPSTYRHIREVAIPLCEKYGIEFVWISSDKYPIRDARSLFQWMWNRKMIPISGPSRSCTIQAKVERFEKWLNDRFGDEPVEVWVGFEAGEEDRAAKDPNAGRSSQRRNRFPLMEVGLCRCRIEEMVREAGFPVPRKSACVFCPYGTKQDFRTLAAELPEVFDKIVEMEERKPPTAANGRKLSIKGYDARKRDRLEEKGLVYTPPTLREFIAAPDKSRPRPPCSVCGSTTPATKATGCTYLDEDTKLVRIGTAA